MASLVGKAEHEKSAIWGEKNLRWLISANLLMLLMFHKLKRDCPEFDSSFDLEKQCLAERWNQMCTGPR